MSETNLNENQELENKKLLLIKTMVLAENALKLGKITENMFFRIKAGIDQYLFILEEPTLEKSRTSHISLSKITENSKNVKVDKRDIAVKKYINAEVDMLKKFSKFMENKNKYSAHEFVKLIEAQQKIDKKFFNK